MLMENKEEGELQIPLFGREISLRKDVRYENHVERCICFHREDLKLYSGLSKMLYSWEQGGFKNCFTVFKTGEVLKYSATINFVVLDLLTIA